MSAADGSKRKPHVPAYAATSILEPCVRCDELWNCKLRAATRTRALLFAAEIGGTVADDPRGSSSPVILVDAEAAE